MAQALSVSLFPVLRASISQATRAGAPVKALSENQALAEEVTKAATEVVEKWKEDVRASRKGNSGNETTGVS